LESEMRIIHVTAAPISLRFVEGMTRLFESRGIEVSAISSPGPELAGVRERMAVHEVPIARGIAPLGDLLSIARLVLSFRALRPDVVIGHMSKAGLVSMIAATIARVPHRLYFNHGMALFRASGITRALLRWSEKVSCFLAHEVLCVSHSVRRFAIGSGLCAATKIHVPASGSVDGIDAADRYRRRTGDREEVRGRLGIGEDAFVLGFVGRLIEDKGIPWLLEAWRTFRSRHAGARLLLVGGLDGRLPLSPEVLRELESDPTIIRTGNVPDTRPYFAAMDVFALPSLTEGLSTVLLEASAMELPIITTSAPGCIDVIEEGITGTVVPERDASRLARAIERYAEDPALRERHARRGRERMLREFRPEVVREAIHLHVQRLVLGVAVSVLLAAAGCSAPATGAPTPPEIVARPIVERPIAAPITQLPRPDIQVGPGDRITVTVHGLLDGVRPEPFELQVQGSGRVNVPFAGTIDAAGLTADGLSERIAAELGKTRFVSPPTVSVVVVESAQRVSVTGAVVNGGFIELGRASLTLDEVLARAGGVTLDAGNLAFVGGPDGSRRVVSLDDRSAPPPLIVAGSTVHVPAADLVYVTGWVAQPGAFRLTRGMTLTQVVAAAGGVLYQGSASEVHVRRGPPDRATVQTFDIAKIISNEAPDVVVAPGDVIEVGRTIPWAALNEGIELLRGVARVGIGAALF
jgi:glycosyltransferase involved in cell wall biosynthesis/protein involved in polysaccharide export with SLBB domain